MGGRTVVTSVKMHISSGLKGGGIARKCTTHAAAMAIKICTCMYAKLFSFCIAGSPHSSIFRGFRN